MNPSLSSLRSPSCQQQTIVALAILLALRLIAMIVVPLNDTTEARYAEIARKMLQTGDWITLYHDYGVPFWGKPPLSIWLSALSMRFFGVNELAVRLPSLLLSIGTVWLVASLITERNGSKAGWLTVLVLAASLLFYLSAGAVMTDPSLSFCTTLIYVGGWRALVLARKGWGYAAFVGLGLGLLAKGPIAIVLTVMPIGLWILLTRRWKAAWQRLPWIAGSCLVLLIAAPWYWLSESQTPGFLRYFIAGEHLGRFLEPGWKGDRYGYAHTSSPGIIWVYALIALSPWPFAVLCQLRHCKRAWGTLTAQQDGWLSYILLWSTMPLVFFTASSNIIWPYTLPMMPGFAILLTELWSKSPAPPDRTLSLLALSNGIFALGLIVIFVFFPGTVGHTQKAMISAWQADKPALNSQFLLWGEQREFSAEFYSQGRIHNTHDIHQVLTLLNDNTTDYIAVQQRDYEQLPKAIRARFSEIGRFINPNTVMLLLKEQPPLSDLANRAGYE